MIRSVAIIGGGTMGAGIAAACLQSGLDVTMIERDSTALTAGMDRVHAILDSAQRAGCLQDVAHAHLGPDKYLFSGWVVHLPPGPNRP